MEENEITDDSSYYAVLNVPNEASEEDIRRSYRQLAQVFHPDKAQQGSDDAANFMRIQEAYEVLSNEEKRSIYDIYGKKGLEAGMEVGEYLRQPADIRKEFERLKAQERREASVAHRGHYIFKVDACDTMDPYDTDVDHMPELTSIATSNSVQLPLSDTLAASVGCEVGVKKRLGGGSFVCGIRRTFGRDDVVECQAAVGLKQFASVEFRRQMGENTSAVVSTSYQPRAGWGLSLSSSRKLAQNWDTEISYQVGPDSYLAFGLTRRGLKTYVTSRFEVGMSTGIVFKAVWQATAAISLRMSAKFGTMGMEVELGGSHRLTEFSTAGCAVAAGLQGIVMRPRFSRGGHTFEMPIMLTPHVQDYQLLVASCLLPPALGFVIKFWIVKPLKRRAKLQKSIDEAKRAVLHSRHGTLLFAPLQQFSSCEHKSPPQSEEPLCNNSNLASCVQALAERQERVTEIEGAVHSAELASRSLHGIATRKMRSEAQQGGLVVLNAKYGTLEAIRLAESQELQGPTENGVQANGDYAGPQFSPTQASSVSDSDDESAAEVQKAMRHAPVLPPAWLDVTDAVRYLVSSSQLRLNKGYSKAGLIGFADVAVGEEKVLRVHFLYQGKPFFITIDDKVRAELEAFDSKMRPHQ